jgi:choice-of-anchor B domain-containing protein
VGPHGLQIFDLARLRPLYDDPSARPATFEPDVIYREVASVHNVVVNEATDFAYLVGSSDGGTTCGGALHMVDLSDIDNPTFAGCHHDVSSPVAGRGATHDAQCIVYSGPDAEHRGKEICLSSNESALNISDVTDKSAPETLAYVTFPKVAYAHQGWLTDDQRYFFMNDEADELNPDFELPGTRTLVWDVADLDDPVLVKEFYGTNAASDHNLYLHNGLMYQSNYIGGLRIIDVQDPLNPREVGFFDTVPWSENVPGFAGSWSNYPYFESGVIAVSSINEGLFLVRYSPPEAQ